MAKEKNRSHDAILQAPPSGCGWNAFFACARAGTSHYVIGPKCSGAIPLAALQSSRLAATRVQPTSAMALAR
jgi:hypothetical protein